MDAADREVAADFGGGGGGCWGYPSCLKILCNFSPFLI